MPCLGIRWGASAFLDHQKHLKCTAQLVDPLCHLSVCACRNPFYWWRNKALSRSHWHRISGHQRSSCHCMWRWGGHPLAAHVPWQNHPILTWRTTHHWQSWQPRQAMFRRWVLSGLILWWSAHFGCSQTSLVCSKRKKRRQMCHTIRVP